VTDIRTPDDALRSLVVRFGVEVPDDLLLEAVTHRSYAYENGNLRPNERLEFLGDAVLGIVVTDALYRRNPDVAEGQLAKMRAAVVNARALADIARGVGLGDHLLLGRGEHTTGGRDKTSILSDSLEAVFGAVYLAEGLDVAAEMILRLMEPILAATAELGAGLDWKTSLQELTSQLGLGVPEYVVAASGPDHDKSFIAVVRLSDGDHGEGRGTSKKEAEQDAARQAFEELDAERES
jgi:ribonuclease-3